MQIPKDFEWVEISDLRAGDITLYQCVEDSVLEYTPTTVTCVETTNEGRTRYTTTHHPHFYPGTYPQGTKSPRKIK